MAKKIYKAEPGMKPLGTRPNKAVEKTSVTAKAKPSATSGKLKIANVKVSVSGGPKPKAVVTGKPMTSAAKVAKPAIKATVKATIKPMTEAQKQAKALDALEAKRAAVAKKTGKRPNYGTN